MKANRYTIAQIQMALSEKNMSQSDLAKKIGMHRSNVSKLLKGQINTIDDEVVDSINDVLEIDLKPLNTKEGVASPVAVKLTELSESNQHVATLLESLCKALDRPVEPFLPQVHQKDLIKIGAEITRVVHEWEDGQNPHYAKIGAESLTFLRKFYEKASRKSS